jgi:hypothetical protein
MATQDIKKGADGKVYFKPVGWSAYIEGDVFKWEGTFSGNPRDVSGSKSGRKRIGGLPDAGGTLSMHYDAANRPVDPTVNTGLNLRPNASINLDLVPEGSPSGGTNGYRFLAIVESIKPSIETTGDNDFDVTWSLADGSTLKYPGDV